MAQTFPFKENALTVFISFCLWCKDGTVISENVSWEMFWNNSSLFRQGNAQHIMQRLKREVPSTGFFKVSSALHVNPEPPKVSLVDFELTCNVEVVDRTYLSLTRAGEKKLGEKVPEVPSIFRFRRRVLRQFVIKLPLADYFLKSVRHLGRGPAAYAQ